MSYVPLRPLQFRVNRDLAVEAVGVSHDRDELELGFQALELGLNRLQFTVGERVDGEHGPQLPIEFPLRRSWDDSSEDLVLLEANAGSEGDEFELTPKGARTWRLQWRQQKTIVAEIAGDPPDAPPADLWNRATKSSLDVQSLRLEPEADGKLALSGRVRSVNAPPLNRGFSASVSYTGFVVPAEVDAEGELRSHLPRPANCSATMRFTIAMQVFIDHARSTADSGDIQILTHFGGATMTVDESPSAEFRDVIPAGRVPVAIKFAMESYRPAETAITLTAHDEGRAYRFRMQDDGAGRYRLLDPDSRNAGLQNLFEDQLEVRLDSQTDLAGKVSVIPLTLFGHWLARDGSFEWHPDRPMSHSEIPRADDSSRPQLVDYRGMRIAVDPTGFEALLAKDPQAVFSNKEITLVNSRNTRPRWKEYECLALDNPVGTLQERGPARFRTPSDLREELKKESPIIIQSADGSEQGLLWAPSSLPEPAGWQRVAIDAIDGAEGRPAVVYFRGIYFNVLIQKVTSGTSLHSIIEVQPALVFPRHLQVEPFLPLMMQVTGNPPDRVLLWQFGEEPATLHIRSDCLLAGPGVGYVFRRNDAGADTLEWFVFPPSSDEAEVIYSTWRGFLLRFDASKGQVQFAGWFLANGEATYPRRTPFDSYRFAHKRKNTSGTLRGITGRVKGDWEWSEDSTICEEDRAMLAERVRTIFPKASKNADDLVNRDAKDHEEKSASRSYLLQPFWSMSQQSLQIKVTEQPVEAARGIEAVFLFVEKKKN